MNDSHVTLYRKYRPKEFSEVRGQDHIVTTLMGSLASKTFSHAYLFSGTRGIGKTTLARIFAHELGVSRDDVYEIDGASNRKIDDIRAIRDGVLALPLNSPYKVYLIDEVHMLTKEAFNALLKTLEEPPSHVIFMFATTEVHKVPETIVSRCQVFTLRKPSLSVLSGLVQDIAKKEKLTLEPDVATTIALLGDGSFRDTIGVLQQIAGSGETKISNELVARITGAPPRTIIHQLQTAIKEGDIDQALRSLHEVEAGNMSVSFTLDQLIHHVRRVLLVRFSKTVANELEKELSKDEMDVVKSLASKEGANINASVLVRLLEASLKVRHSAYPIVECELAMMDIINKE